MVQEQGAWLVVNLGYETKICYYCDTRIAWHLYKVHLCPRKAEHKLAINRQEILDDRITSLKLYKALKDNPSNLGRWLSKQIGRSI